MRRWGLLIAAVAALSGCKHSDKDRSPRDRPPNAEPASRTKTQPSTGKGWLEGPTPGLDRIDTPPADSWGDPRGAGFDVDREVRGILAGFVEDPDGRKLRDVFIEVEPVHTSSGGAPVGVQTDRQGYFLIKGLKPKQTYQLTARLKTEGREFAGRVYAQTSNERSQFIRITLLDGLSFPGGKTNGEDLPGGKTSSPSSAVTPNEKSTTPPATIPPPVFPSSGPNSSASTEDGSWSPTGPKTKPQEPTPAPTSGTSRPDLITEGQPGIWKPPATNIPSHSQPAPQPKSVTPPPPKSPPASEASRSKSKSIKPGAGFVLLDTVGFSREFPSGQPSELVLLDFMTTNCVPCKKAIPSLKELQAKFGLRGCEVVGVTCDDVPLPQRRALASAYQRNERLNYLLYAEPESGKVARRFDVQSYPTLVLLDGTGEILWKGHPRDVADLENVIASELARRQR